MDFIQFFDESDAIDFNMDLENMLLFIESELHFLFQFLVLIHGGCLKLESDFSTLDIGHRVFQDLKNEVQTF
jgi:hypothetical protein